jgi:hypothetical protein
MKTHLSQLYDVVIVTINMYDQSKESKRNDERMWKKECSHGVYHLQARAHMIE